MDIFINYSKRSNFITRLSSEKKQGLIIRLTHLAESWGGKDNGFGLAECCSDLPIEVSVEIIIVLLLLTSNQLL